MKELVMYGVDGNMLELIVKWIFVVGYKCGKCVDKLKFKCSM